MVQPSFFDEFGALFKALSSETRIRVIDLLTQGERCVCEITAELGLSQPLVSHHLSLLREASLVHRRGDGARTYYSIDWRQFDHLVAGLQLLVDTGCAETETGGSTGVCARAWGTAGRSAPSSTR